MSVSVFAERLRNAMNSRGLKQVDLVHAAEHRGVKMGKSHISQYVAGHHRDALGCSPARAR